MSTATAEAPRTTYRGPEGATPAPTRGRDTARWLPPAWRAKYTTDDSTVYYDYGDGLDPEAQAHVDADYAVYRKRIAEHNRFVRANPTAQRMIRSYRRTGRLPDVLPGPGHCTRARESRGSAPGRRQGSRRVASRSAGGGSSGSDDDGESEPPGLPLWRHDDYGQVNPSLYRLLLREGRS